MDSSLRGLRDAERSNPDSGEGNAVYFPPNQDAISVEEDHLCDCWGIEPDPLLSKKTIGPPPQTMVPVHDSNASLISSTKRLAALNVQDPYESLSKAGNATRHDSLAVDATTAALDAEHGVHNGSGVVTSQQPLPACPRTWSPLDDVYSAHDLSTKMKQLAKYMGHASKTRGITTTSHLKGKMH